jgi:DNA-binding Lrp family transcriptional regulator
LGFSRISELRDLLASIPKGVITCAQRLILHTINSYTNDDDPDGACWIGYEQLAKEIGKTPRGVFDDIKQLRALGLVERRVKYARLGSRQKYFICWERLYELASVNSTSHLLLGSMYSTDLEGELERKGVRTPLPTNRNYKNNKQINNLSLIENIKSLMPYTKRAKFKDDLTVDQLISVYLSKKGEREALIERFKGVTWNEIQTPQRFIESELRKAIEALEGGGSPDLS